MPPIHGSDAQVFVDTSGSLTDISSATWTLVENAEDINPPGSRETDTRQPRAASSGVAVPGKLNLEASFSMLIDPADTVYTGLRDAFANRTVIGVAFAEGDPSGTPSVGAWTYLAYITDMSPGFPVGGAATVEVSVAPAPFPAATGQAYDSDFSPSGT